MNIRELNKPINSKTLNETLAKKFGTKINVESFTLEQLQDARNKIRTKLSDIETNESFSGLPKNETYVKNKLFLDVLNAAISERADVDEGDDKDEDGDKDFADIQIARMVKSGMSKADAIKKTKNKKYNEDQVDEFDGVDSKKDSDINLMKMVQKKFGTKTGRNLGRISGDRYRTGSGDPADMDVALDDPAVKMMLDAGVLTLNPSALQKYKAMYGESIVREGEEDKAELVMAAKDMVDRLTGWMEDTAEMQSESMLELADAIRDEMGAQQSESFTNTVKPALESLYAAMEQTRVSLTQGVGMLTGEAEVAEPMGDEPAIEPEAEMEPTVDAEGATDEFGAAEAAAGGEDEAGRARRESINLSRRLGTILSSRK